MELFSNKFAILVILLQLATNNSASTDETCHVGGECSVSSRYGKPTEDDSIYAKASSALRNYVPCNNTNCNCHSDVIDNDLAPFSGGITKKDFDIAVAKATKYQIIDGKLYRNKDCHFPARCSGVEHYLLKMAPQLPNIEIALNTRDWPQFNGAWNHPKAPVFSFSKTKEYYDIMYPAWSFWAGGPAIKLYPTGIGRWDVHRDSITKAAEKWPWEKKKPIAFFRGSRTNDERDALIMLSRSQPDLVDAQYTKNQAWKSDADTLNAPPAEEVSFEDHCNYKYLFNFRGIAASFRLKHLFLCKSLVFHVGDQWLEFFYPLLKPWVHYVPVSANAKQNEIEELIRYYKEHDLEAKAIAERGYSHIWDNLRDKDVLCYWRKLLKRYSKLIKYEVKKDDSLILISK